MLSSFIPADHDYPAVALRLWNKRNSAAIRNHCRGILGAGNKAIVTKWADGNLQLFEGQPFFSGQCIQLTKAAPDIFLHPILKTKMACAAGAELYGA